MKEHGYSEEAANAVWDILVPFSGYAFNKALVAKRNYHYATLADNLTYHEALRTEVAEAFAASKGGYGYRGIMAEPTR